MQHVNDVLNAGRLILAGLGDAHVGRQVFVQLTIGNHIRQTLGHWLALEFVEHAGFGAWRLQLFEVFWVDCTCQSIPKVGAVGLSFLQVLIDALELISCCGNVFLMLLKIGLLFF